MSSNRRHRRLRRVGVAALALTAGLAGTVLTAVPASAHGTHVLVFSKTAGFRHDSIADGIATIRALGEANGFEVVATEDAAAFTDTNLSQYAAVVWLSTTGDVLNAEQQAAFERYIAAGGGYAGVHAAADTEYDWPWYGQLVGSYFKSHPNIQQAVVQVETKNHPSTESLPDTWIRTDEWYSYRSNPRGQVRVLASLDETSYSPTDPSGDHPIAWCKTEGAGRSWYTGMGHTRETYADATFRQHLLGGIRYAAGLAQADCSPDSGGPPVDSDFDQVTLARGAEKTGEPIALAVLPDRKVIHTSRDGRVWLTTPEATTKLAGRVPVYSHDEDGLQGVAVDPGFATDRWVYLYYAPPLNTPTSDAPTNGGPEAFAPYQGHNQLSRFKLTEQGVLDLASEQRVLQVPANRGICCHAGGEIDFDAQGNLYLSTGDDTNPFASDRYTPIDERADRNPAFDAQRSSGNTNDLRGKVLRIKVEDDGSYTIPSGNLFAPGTAKTRPEIYAMGLRNPFRFAVDRRTGWIHLGDYGPDADGANPSRGPGGIVEFNLIKGPGNYGWPYCIGANVPYIDYDFATGASGSAFNCAAPSNNSPNNTGLVDLPPAQPAWIPYDGGSVPEFGSGTESPMGGPTYAFDAANPAVTKFPEYFDGKNFAYEWDRGWIKTIDVGANGERGAIRSFFSSMDLVRPMNLEFGPDGSLYVLDYGSGYFGGAPDSALYRIDFTEGKHTPAVKLAADKTSGPAPLTVRFDPAGTSDKDGPELSWAWDFDGDGTTDSTQAGAVTHTYQALGEYNAKLSVTDPTGLTGSATVTVTVGNTQPVVTITAPANGKVFSFGDAVPFTVTVTDPEDGAIDCSKVTVEYILGHDSHGHPLSPATGCQGTIVTSSEDGHGADANVFGVVNASYTDRGAAGASPLTGSAEVVLQPKIKQAEFFTTSQGIQILEVDGAAGNKRVGHIDNGDWIMFDPVNLAGVGGIGYRVSSGGQGGLIEVHSGAPDGPLVQSMPVVKTGSYETYADLPATPITDPGGTHPLYFVFKGNSGGIFDIDEIRFVPGAVAPLTLVPAESSNAFQGVGIYDSQGAQGGKQVGDIHDGDWIAFNGVDLSQVTGLGYRVASAGVGGRIEVRADAPDGPLLQTTAVANTGNWRTYASLAPTAVTDPGGTHRLYFVFRGGSGALFDIDTIVAAGTWRLGVSDTTAPTTTGTVAPATPGSGWHTSTPVVTLSADEPGTTEYRVGTEWTRYTEPFTLGDGVHNVEYRTTDGSGNVESPKTLQVKVDTTAPLTTATFNPEWNAGAVAVALGATDAGSGPAATEWRLDGGPWTAYAGPVPVSGDGAHTLLYRSRDLAGNVETEKAATIKIDGTAPTLMVSGIAPGQVYGDAADVVVSWSASDATSGLRSVTGALDGKSLLSGAVVPLYTLSLGLHELAVTAEDNAGNRTTSTIAFGTTTSLRDISRLLDRFRSGNLLSAAAYRNLSTQLSKVRAAEAADEDRKAVRELDRFKALVNTKVTNADVRAVLLRDADYVRVTLIGNTQVARRTR